jgi:hypothetical protein
VTLGADGSLLVVAPEASLPKLTDDDIEGR